MMTASARRWSSLATVLILLGAGAAPCHGQEDPMMPGLTGLGLEFGGGHSELLWRIMDYSTGVTDDGDRRVPYLQPVARLTWTLNISSAWYMTPFAGVARFGGRSRVINDGYEDRFLFEAVQAGFHLRPLSGSTLFSLGIAYNRHLKVTRKYHGGVLDPPEDRTWQTRDETDFFVLDSVELHLRIGRRLWAKGILWLEFARGTSRLLDLDFQYLDIDVRQNSFRLLLATDLR